MEYNHISDLAKIEKLPPGSYDLHGYGLAQVKEFIPVKLSAAKRTGIHYVTFIHGFNSGTAIRSYLWESIANNAWPGTVPRSSEKNLLQILEKYGNQCNKFDISNLYQSCWKSWNVYV